MPNLPPVDPATLDRRSSRADDLIQAFLEQMAVSGIAGATARAVAARAGTSASAIHYHFHSLEQLYGVAQQRAIGETRVWLRERLAEAAAGAPWTPAGFPAFATAVIDDWCGRKRVLAQAEACDTVALAWWTSGTAAQWMGLWETFWATALSRFSLSADLSPVAAAVLQSERFGHLVRWRTLHDRAGLEEVCTRLTARLSGDPELLARPAPWRDAAEALSQRKTVFPPLTGAAARIAGAVVSAVDVAGEGALTHRAAALEAGLSLGAVTHHFPTRAALMTAGYASVYEGILGSAERWGAMTARHDDLGRHILSFLEMGSAAPGVRAFETFFFAATRDPALADFAARVRYSRGATTLSYLGPVAPQLTRMDALLLSHWITGAARRILADPEGAPEVRQAIPTFAPALFPRA